MESFSTRRFFSSEFVIKNKLSFSTVIILQDIYHWILSDNPPKQIIKNNKKYFYLSQSHFQRFNYGLLTQPAVNKIFNKLKEIKIIESSSREGNENYISFNWEKIKESLISEQELKIMSDNEWWKRIHEYANEQIKFENSYNKKEENEMNNSLFDMEDEKSKKIKYSENAYLIAVKIIEKAKSNNSGFFGNHKCKEYGEEQTKLMTQSCNSIQSIYDGNFINPRLYPFSEKFLSNQQFKLDMNEVKSILNEVKSDWNKVRKLILGAFKNFELMHKPEYVPCDKKYLIHNLNEWFYAISFEEAGKFQSQFLQSLFEPMKTPEFYSEKKADVIYEDLSTSVKVAGNKLFEMNTNMNSGTYWEKIKDIVEWAKLILELEPNAHYWISSPSDIITKFNEYCENKNIVVNVSTLDIQKSFESNTPFSWFVEEAINEHGLNKNLLNCITPEDFVDAYNTNNDNLSFDDMSDVDIIF